MDDLELMKRAKIFIDKLANGIDPLTDKPVPETDMVNNVRVARCLFYVSDVLRKVIGDSNDNRHHEVFLDEKRWQEKAILAVTR